MIGERKNMTILLPAFVLGFVTMVTQMAVFREFALLFSSNELIYAVLLSFWLVFTGAGVWFAGIVFKNKKDVSFLLSALYSVLTLVLWTLIPRIRDLLVPEGEVASPSAITGASAMILLPLCFISGMLYVIYSSASDEKRNVSRVYSADVAGAIAGSLAYYFTLSFYIETHILLLSALIILPAVSLICSFLQRIWLSRKTLWLYIALLFVILAAPFIRRYHDSGILPRQMTIENRDGLNGKYIITKNNEQFNLYSSATFILCSDYKLPAEEFVHTAMLQNDDPRRVLVVNNYSPVVAEQIEKYNPSSVTFLETDPVKTELINKYFAADSKTVPQIVYADVRTFLDTAKPGFDVIMVHTDGITSLHDNRFFTQRFFGEIKRSLNPGGFLLMNWRSASDYYGGGFAEINGTIRNTALTVFGSVKMIPLSTVYLVASADAKINQRVGEAAVEKGIVCDYINPYYIDDNITEDRIKGLEKKLENNGTINTEEKPVLFLQDIRFWLSQYKPYYFFVPLLILLLIVLVAAIRNIPYGLTMYITGFTTSSFMTLLLLMFVCVSGSMLRDISLFFAVSMAGMALGSMTGGLKYFHRKNKIVLLPLLIMVILPVVVMISQGQIYETSLAAGRMTVLLFLFFSSLCGGLVFAVLSERMPDSNRKNSSLLFSLDMWGSFAGGLLCSLVLIPFLNTTYTCLLISGLALTAILINFISLKK